MALGGRVVRPGSSIEQSEEVCVVKILGVMTRSPIISRNDSKCFSVIESPTKRTCL